MKKFIGILIACCASLSSYSQILASVETTAASIVPTAASIDFREKKYPEADSYVLGLKKKYDDVRELSRDLTAPFKTDEDKVRAIYIWICNNIAYDIKEARNELLASRMEAMRFPAYKYFSTYFADEVLERKKGTCAGYAQLFYELCTRADIKCEIVPGYASQNESVIRFLRKTNLYNSDHAWNKVKLNGEFYYVDLTWSSGTVFRNKFSRHLNLDYYLVPVDQLYPTHAEGDFTISCRDVGN